MILYIYIYIYIYIVHKSLSEEIQCSKNLFEEKGKKFVKLCKLDYYAG